MTSVVLSTIPVGSDCRILALHWQEWAEGKRIMLNKTKSPTKLKPVSAFWKAVWPKRSCLQNSGICKPRVMQQEIRAGKTS